MIEDYQIQCRIGRAKPTGKIEANRFGKSKAVTVYSEEYETAAGIFSSAVWKEKALHAIEDENQTELLEKVKRYCKQHCAWMKSKTALEEYAIDCLCGRSYRYWPDFKE